MSALLHPLLVAFALLLPQGGVSMSVLSGLCWVGVFALLLGLGYVLLAQRWMGHHRHPHR